MSDLNEVIANVACILDSLIAYRSIIQCGNCNNCKRRAEGCEFAPDAGHMVRYNCPFYKKDGE